MESDEEMGWLWFRKQSRYHPEKGQVRKNPLNAAMIQVMRKKKRSPMPAGKTRALYHRCGEGSHRAFSIRTRWEEGDCSPTQKIKADGSVAGTVRVRISENIRRRWYCSLPTCAKPGFFGKRITKRIDKRLYSSAGERLREVSSTVRGLVK